METIKLNNGIEMPMVGYGVFQVTDLNACENAVSMAIEEGYRLIDTASVYQNEEAVGRAIADSGINRSEFFITSKAYIQEMGYEQTLKAFEQSLKKLGLEYLDLYLIHQPFGDYYGAWRAMEELYQAGRIRAIGVSNFYSSLLIDLCYNTKIIPAVNQIELHPFYQRSEELKLMDELRICPQAWAPFAEGMNNMFANPVITCIAQKYGKTVAQVILKWNVQRGVSVIPKSIHRERITENFAIWDFKLNEQDMETMATLDLKHCQMLDPLDPKEVKRVYEYLRNPVLK